MKTGKRTPIIVVPRINGGVSLRQGKSYINIAAFELEQVIAAMRENVNIEFDTIESEW